MASKTLKKALQGDEYALVLMTELLQTKKISTKDAEYIRDTKKSNPNQDYLYACCEYWGIGTNQNILAAKHLLKPLAAKGNGFANNLLSLIYRDPDDTDKPSLYLKQAVKAHNPLGILNSINATTLNFIDYAPQIYHRLSPFYQQSLMNLAERHYQRLTTAEEHYQFARCLEKMNLRPRMYQAFHRAIELSEDKSKYQRKLVKTLEQQVNADRRGIFKTALDPDYLKKRLSAIKKNLRALENSESNEKQTELPFIELELMNCTYILQEKEPHFKPAQCQSLHELLTETVRIYKTLRSATPLVEQEPPASPKMG
ncbi:MULTISPECIES: hypothetical protein [unclassified Legionella]|uniref:hypothetical protein n=1 Tax=unclassified Legionella TaxID=2622702 RepID=UPI0010555CAF|nr:MULTISPECIES: hypothetical protein [unclassified Legionella]MDI9819788.1 hypothetical protein [Legionella sp. PL877]